MCRSLEKRLIQFHCQSILSPSLSIFSSLTPRLISLEVCFRETASAGRHTAKNNSSGINLNSLTALNQPVVRMFHRFMTNAAGACPTFAPALCCHIVNMLRAMLLYSLRGKQSGGGHTGKKLWRNSIQNKQ